MHLALSAAVRSVTYQCMGQYVLWGTKIGRTNGEIAASEEARHWPAVSCQKNPGCDFAEGLVLVQHQRAADSRYVQQVRTAA